MKVLHITNLFPTKDNVSYGIFVKEQIDSLKALGIDCEIVFINAACNGKFEYFKKIIEIKNKSKEFDIIHCHHTYSAFFTLFFARVKKPVVTSFLTQGGMDGKSKRFYWLKHSMYKYAQKQSYCYIIKNSGQSDPCCKDKEVCIPNGVDLDLFREFPRSESLKKLGLANKKYILFCSSTNLYRSEKRYDLFREVIRIIKTEYDSEVEELALENEERRQMPYFFNGVSVHLLTSDFEGSPNSVKEALACNTPVVARDVGNVKLMLGSVDGCFVSQTDDPYELADLTVQAMSFQKITGRKRLVELNLDMRSVAEQIRAVYINTLGPQKVACLDDGV